MDKNKRLVNGYFKKLNKELSHRLPGTKVMRYLPLKPVYYSSLMSEVINNLRDRSFKVIKGGKKK